MTDPRTPADKEMEAQLPDDLNQIPEQSMGLFGRRGSEDAQLLAGEGKTEGDEENDAATADAAPPDESGQTND
jgi:hypothetical protein